MSAAEALFLDTNVLVYAHDRMETIKGPKAQALLGRIFAVGRPLVSMQVLSEFYWVVTRKIPAPLTHDEATAEIQRFNVLAQVVPLTWEILERALQAVVVHGMALWDAQILAAATVHGGTKVLSEDFQHRRTIDGITFLNPFAPDFDYAEVGIP